MSIFGFILIVAICISLAYISTKQEMSEDEKIINSPLEAIIGIIVFILATIFLWNFAQWLSEQ